MAPPADGATHVVLCIDHSGSMKTSDVPDERYGGDARCSRADAVLRCACKLLRDVLARTCSGAETLVSVVYFDDQARAVVNARALNAELVSQLMTRSEANPKGGTNYSEGLARVESAISQADATTILVHEVIFLTDGRPGELGGNKPLPALGHEKQTARYHLADHPSAAAIVRRLAHAHGSRFSLHTMGVGEDDFRWPKRLVEIAVACGAKGEFTQVAAVAVRAPAAVIKRQGARFKLPTARGLSAVPENRSAADIQISPARTTGSAAMAPPVALSTSLSSAFDSISSSITASMGTGAQKTLRPYNPEPVDAWKKTEGWTSLLAHRLVDERDGGAERWVQVTINIRAKPFGRGGQRNAFHMKLSGDHYVAKESRWEGDESERLSALKLSVKQTKAAETLAEEFNAALDTKGIQEGIEEPIKISVVPCSICKT